MQDQDGDGCRKCFLRKRQRRCIPLQNIAVCALDSLEKPGGERVAVLDARHSPGVFSQFFRGRARPCANFKNAFAQIRTGQKATGLFASASCAASTTKHKTSSQTDSQKHVQSAARERLAQIGNDRQVKVEREEEPETVRPRLCDEEQISGLAFRSGRTLKKEQTREVRARWRQRCPRQPSRRAKGDPPASEPS